MRQLFSYSYYKELKADLSSKEEPSRDSTKEQLTSAYFNAGYEWASASYNKALDENTEKLNKAVEQSHTEGRPLQINGKYFLPAKKRADDTLEAFWADDPYKNLTYKPETINKL